MRRMACVLVVLFVCTTAACDAGAPALVPLEDAFVPERDAGDGSAMQDAAPRDASVRDASVRDAAMPRDAGPLIIEPTLGVSSATIDAALRCPSDFARTYDPILLVHGTGANADLSWDWAYVPALTALGFDVCTVDLPSSSWEDVPTAAEHVVASVRVIRAVSGRPVTLIGHSQGSLEIRWALRYWPSLRPQVSEVIALAGVEHGTAQAQQICSIGICRVATWQMRPTSALLAALNTDEGTDGVPYTSIFSATDSTAVPPTSVLAGTQSIEVQSICPGREVSHAAMISDAVVFALVHAALRTKARVTTEWIDRSVCNEDRMSVTTTSKARGEEARGTTYFLATYLGGREPSEEPALPAYASP